MPNTETIALLHQQLAAQRATLDQLLDQQGAAEAIAAARAVIAQLTAQLRDQSVAVEGEADVVARHHTQTISGQAQVGVAISGDVYGHIYLPARHTTLAPIDLDQARQLLDRLPLDTIPEPTRSLPIGSRMPLLRNSDFVGRNQELRKLAASIKSNEVAAITTGIGGVGKTQLASEFAHRYGQFFAGGVFWLSFADPAGIDSEIAACGGAGALELYTDADKLKQAEQVQRVYAAWAQETPRLLIFDNCDDQQGITAEKLLLDRLPRSDGCRVLVTSRRGQWSTGLHLSTLALEVLGRKASIALLRSHREDLSDADANAIAREVGDLPLALTLAGSYLATYRDEAFGVPATYLANLKQHLLDHRSLKGAGATPSLTKHDLNVRATFALSYERLNHDDPTDALAIAALARAACLAPGEPFPRDLLLATLGDATDDEEIAAQRADAIGRLVALGLLESATGRTLRMHRLIAAFAQGAREDVGAQAAVEVVLIEAADVINNAGYPYHMQSIIAHLRYATEATFGLEDERAAQLCNCLNRCLKFMGSYIDARRYGERALYIYEQFVGPTHPNTAIMLNNLAEVLRALGKYAEAQSLYKRALHIYEEVIGLTHPDTATILNNLAELLYAQGAYTEAQSLCKRALCIRERFVGLIHRDTAQSLSNLGALFQAQGAYAEAQPLYERALHIYEQVVGPTHPDTAQSLNSLATLFQAQGAYAEAQPLYERALHIYEQVVGPVHPYTAQSLNNLGTLFQEQGAYAEAQPLYERALHIYEQVVGPVHPLTAQSLNNLGTLFHTQGAYAEAQPLYKRALHIYEQVVGPTHPDIAQSLNNLAEVLRAQGAYAEAQPLYERALHIYEQVVGPNHPLIADTLNNLAALLQQQGVVQTARIYHERALAIREAAFGPQHPNTAQSLWWIGALLLQTDDRTNARSYFQRAATIYTHALGPTHPMTQQCQQQLDALTTNQRAVNRRPQQPGRSRRR